MIKNLSANAGEVGLTLSQEDPMEKEMATYCSILSCRSPWTEKLEGYSLWGCKRVGKQLSMHA